MRSGRHTVLDAFVVLALCGCGGDDSGSGSAGTSGAGGGGNRPVSRDVVVVPEESDEVVSLSASDEAFLTPDYGVFDGMPVTVRSPVGFTAAPDGDGFVQMSTGSQVSFSHQRSAYSSMIRFPLMTVEGTERAEFGDIEGLLIHGTQESRGYSSSLMGVWVAVLGDDEESAMVWGFYPKDREGQMSRALRASVLSARWTKGLGDPFRDLSYEVTAGGGFEYAGKVDGLVTFAEGGRSGLGDGGGPRFVLSPRYSLVNVDDVDAFASDRLISRPGLSGVELQVHEGVDVAGLGGIESMGVGVDSVTGGDVYVYQLMVFDNTRYWILYGSTPLDRWQRDVPVFMEMGKSFVMK